MVSSDLRSNQTDMESDIKTIMKSMMENLFRGLGLGLEDVYHEVKLRED